MADKEMLTVAKMAEAWGVSPNAIKKAIQKLGLNPDAKKGVCSYYTKESADKIKAGLEKK